MRVVDHRDGALPGRAPLGMARRVAAIAAERPVAAAARECTAREEPELA